VADQDNNRLHPLTRTSNARRRDKSVRRTCRLSG
jgi:hypothetical protein